MRLFIHALGASAGGGLTYLRNVLPHLARQSDLEVLLLAGREAVNSPPRNVHVLETKGSAHGALSRFFWEQRELPRILRDQRADVLLCAGNFAVWRSPVPQILLSRNSLYTSADFDRDLRRRGDYALLMDTRVKGFLARKSVERAELTIAPSEAFAHELRAWTSRRVVALHHGFDRDLFFRDAEPLPQPMEQKLRRTEGTVSLLFVSHYNYYRNFETLLKGFARLKQRQKACKVRLVLTCELAPGKNPGNYDTGEASDLLRRLEIDEDVVQLGAVPYSKLHQVYRACDVYVTPAYAETFAHPLVEAMACGLPIVASDLVVHREITAEAAVFFERLSADDLAEKLSLVIGSPELQSSLRERGMKRSASFSWGSHVETLVKLAKSLVQRQPCGTD